LTELGGGFKLALRDLEIRGSGNLLGAQQHGHIAAVGFDLYTKLLEEAVRELKGEPASAAVEPTVTVDAEALLPDDYVSEVNQRLALYKRLADIVQAEEIDEIRAELADRFGPLPEAVEALLDVIGLRVLARALGIERVEARGGRAMLTFSPTTPLSPAHILAVIGKSRGRITMRKEYTMEAQIPAGRWPAPRADLERLLKSLHAV
jgi:transcription-repair coupling factor (superfamily II helicase)